MNAHRRLRDYSDTELQRLTPEEIRRLVVVEAEHRIADARDREHLDLSDLKTKDIRDEEDLRIYIHQKANELANGKLRDAKASSTRWSVAACILGALLLVIMLGGYWRWYAHYRPIDIELANVRQQAEQATAKLAAAMKDAEVARREVSNLTAKLAVAVTPSAKPGPEAAAAAQSNYTVRQGDYLWKIARQRYSHPEAWVLIYDRNKNVIGGNPDLIQPGQVLEIPTYDESKAAKLVPPAPHREARTTPRPSAPRSSEAPQRLERPAQSSPAKDLINDQLHRPQDSASPSTGMVRPSSDEPIVLDPSEDAPLFPSVQDNVRDDSRCPTGRDCRDTKQPVVSDTMPPRGIRPELQGCAGPNCGPTTTNDRPVGLDENPDSKFRQEQPEEQDWRMPGDNLDNDVPLMVPSTRVSRLWVHTASDRALSNASRHPVIGLPVYGVAAALVPVASLAPPTLHTVPWVHHGSQLAGYGNA